MKKIGILLLILCHLVCCVPIFAIAEEIESTAEISTEATAADENFAVASGSFSLDALNPLLGTDKLVDNVRSAIVYEANSQTLMYAWNPDAQMYPASLVKILTALLAIEKGDLSEIVTVTQSAVSSVPYDAVSAKLAVGEKLTLEELLYCMLTGSANDAAAVIAEHISGSQSAFVEEMNQYAQTVGCTATQFTNAHGLHDDNQHTTARDCARILDAALKEPVFKAIFTATEYTVPATNLSPERKLTSGNSMKDTTSKLYYDSRVIGGRTGVAQDGRRCLASAAESNGMLVISIVMGAESVYQDDGYSAISIGGYKETTKLYDACLSGYKTAQILRAEQVLRQVSVEGAQNDLLIGPQISVSTVLPEDISIANLSFRYADKPITLPVSRGEHISDVQIWHGNMCVAQAPLYAMNTLRADDNSQTNVSEVTNDGAPTALKIVIGIVVCAVLVYLAVRFSDNFKKLFIRMRKKRYRDSHKRVR